MKRLAQKDERKPPTALLGDGKRRKRAAIRRLCVAPLTPQSRHQRRTPRNSRAERIWDEANGGPCGNS